MSEPEARKAGAQDDLLQAHYAEFRRVAAGVLRGSGPQLHLQPTELAHEAAIRIVGLDRMDFAGRTHFLSFSARMMRQILVDEVRRARAAKRTPPEISTLWPPGEAGSGIDIELLDVALTKLEALKPEHARLVDQRFFGGLTLEEIAAMDGVSPSTVKRQWRVVRAWLVAELQPV
jgi:RNA polymerase sigma factor (TIGR02999 family)